MLDADVLEHADRDDAVEAALDLAVVVELEAHARPARPRLAAARRVAILPAALGLSVMPVTSRSPSRAR